MQGVDEQIKNRMDTFRGKEQQLAKRYQASQELLDLLALQKLKSEKDQVARSMQMQMQNNPQTIKQQREAEMMQASRQDIAKGVMGALQQKQAQQQANLQKVAQSGVAGQAPTMRMAEGGIVGFAAGDSVLSSPDKGFSVGYDRAYYEELDRIRNDDTMSADEKNAALAALDAKAAQAEAAYQKAANPNTQSDAERLMLDKDSLVMPDMAGVPAFPDAISEESIKVDYSSNPYTDTAKSGISTLTSADPNQAFDDTYEKQLELRKRTEDEDAEVERLREKRQGIEAALLDEDKLAKDRRMATLIGMAGKSTLGLAGAGGAAGAMNAQRTQERGRSKLFNEEQKFEMDELNRSQDIRGLAAGQAQTAYSDAAADRRTGIQSAATLATAYDDKLSAEADRLLKVRVANNDTALAQRAEAVQQARDAASNANRILVTNIATELSLLRLKVDEERNNITGQGNMYQYLTNAMADVSAKITSAEQTLREAANTELLEIESDQQLNLPENAAKKAGRIREVKLRLQDDIKAATTDARKLLNTLAQQQAAAAGQINRKTTGGSRPFKVIR